ncbi:unnamed protein product, partial [Pylaiella littoralis]
DSRTHVCAVRLLNVILNIVGLVFVELVLHVFCVVFVFVSCAWRNLRHRVCVVGRRRNINTKPRASSFWLAWRLMPDECELFASILFLVITLLNFKGADRE